MISRLCSYNTSKLPNHEVPKHLTSNLHIVFPDLMVWNNPPPSGMDLVHVEFGKPSKDSPFEDLSPLSLLSLSSLDFFLQEAFFDT
jgi:hypothetical protein